MINLIDYSALVDMCMSRQMFVAHSCNVVYVLFVCLLLQMIANDKIYKSGHKKYIWQCFGTQTLSGSQLIIRRI